MDNGVTNSKQPEKQIGNNGGNKPTSSLIASKPGSTKRLTKERAKVLVNQAKGGKFAKKKPSNEISSEIEESVKSDIDCSVEVIEEEKMNPKRCPKTNNSSKIMKKEESNSKHE
jgi:hypothetical protein